MRMVALLPSHLLARDYQWIVFTATSAVRGILLGFGAPLVELARADGARVASGRRPSGAAITRRIRACSPASCPTAGRSRASARPRMTTSALHAALRAAAPHRVALDDGEHGS